METRSALKVCGQSAHSHSTQTRITYNYNYLLNYYYLNSKVIKDYVEERILIGGIRHLNHQITTPLYLCRVH